MLLTIAKQGYVVPANAKLYLYQANTTTTFVSYQDGDFATQHGAYIQADANGVLPAIHIKPDSSTNYRQVMKTSAGATEWDEDDIPSNVAFSTDLLPLTDAVSDVGSSTKRWSQGWFLELDLKSGSYLTTISQGPLSGNRSVVIPDSNIILGGRYVSEKSGNYTFTLPDAGNTVALVGASANATFTIPSAIGFYAADIEILNYTNYILTVAPAAGVTLKTNNGSTIGSSSSITMQGGHRIRITMKDVDQWIGESLPFESSFTATIATGLTTTPTGTVTYRKDGHTVTLWCASGLSGTSNSTGMTLTGVPSTIQPTNANIFPIVLTDNSTTVMGMASVTAGTMTFSMGSPLSTTGFTAANTKGIPAGSTFTWMIL